MRKSLFLVLAVLAIPFISNAQSFSINTDGSIADTSAILDVKSSAKGMLIPRMLKTQRTAIFQPAAGLLVYQSGPDSTGFYFYDGSNWLWLVSSAALQAVDTMAWKRNGNGGTNPLLNFVGTTDNQPLNFRVNNTKAGSIDPVKRNTSYGLLSSANNTGFYNVAIGDSALMSNTISSNLTAVGFSAMKKNLVGLYNTAVGTESLLQNISGTHNTATGYLALRNNTGSFNTSFGTLALYSNNTGIRNTGIGCSSLYFTNGNDNVAVGYESLNQNFSGSRNVAVGSNAMRQNSSGNQNIGIGDSSLFNNIFGSNNIAIGKNALHHNINKDNIIAIGDSALYNNGNSTASPQSIENTGIGSKALYANTTGSGNTALGFTALKNNVSGNYNIAFGVNAASNNVNGSSLTVVGYNANTLSAGLNNSTAIGAGSKIGISNAVSIGDSTIGTTVGIGTAYPTQAGLVVNHTVGGFVHAMFGSNTTGVAIESNWPGIGFNSYNNGTRRFITNGYAGRISLDPAAGNMWLLVDGTGTAGNAVPYEKGVVIRDGAGATGSFTPFVDNVSSLGLPGARWTTVYATNSVINTSDAREKKNIVPLGYGLTQIMKLNPVRYQWKNPNAGEQVMLGLLAQDVKKVLPELIVEDKGVYGMRSAEIIPVLVKAMQEQQSIIETLQKQVEAAKAEIPMQTGKQQQTIDQQQKLLEQVMKRLEQLEKKH